MILVALEYDHLGSIKKSIQLCEEHHNLTYEYLFVWLDLNLRLELGLPDTFVRVTSGRNHPLQSGRAA